uniref:tripartite motif-containing protein 16 isoform X2 n=1 Tax=Gasterosteus aculeatus aculeatus TaxID=481459 RepID=UPI001A99CBDA|nr:tripartite motif-containing protein 16 isoform X2 [Gasterosteus aculeatus aculeatus]
MAAATISIEQDQFWCSVCLEVLRDPVTIPCGHSYCLRCIEDYWDGPKQKGAYTCPQCRQAFAPRPLLSRNHVLGEVVEKFQRSGGEEASCSACTGRKSKAVKSCLVCSESYCAPHLRVHEDRFRGRIHKLVPAGEPLRPKLCAHHDKALRLFCRTDQQCVCSQCVQERHKDHDAVPAVEERATQQKKLQEASLKSVQKLKDTEKELRYLVRYIKHSTQATVEESERVFAKLIRAIEKQSSDVTEVMRVQERAAVSQAEELLETIQKQLVELRRTDAELEKVSRTEDHIQFFQKIKSLNFPAKTAAMPSSDALQYTMYKTMRGALADLKGGLDEILEKEFNRISDKGVLSISHVITIKQYLLFTKQITRVCSTFLVISLKETSNQSTAEKRKAKDADIPYNSEPKTRADFLHYSNDLTLDPNTANPYLSFSDGRRGVTTRSEPQPYPDHPHRFTSWAQVLGRAGMAGRCYWEVEWAGSGGVSIGVCYKNMGRSGGGSDSKLGHNSRSWSLDCSPSDCFFQHNKERVTVGAACCSRIGVYLDFRGGTLSFYNVSDAMVLLHKVKTTFAQPVYAGFWVGLSSTLRLCAL